MSDVNSSFKLKRSQRKADIIAKASKMFPKKGIEPVKMTDVATASGVGVASLYRYFGTKVNLALSVGALMWRRFNETFAENLTAEFSSKNGISQMEELLGLYVFMYRTHPEFISFLDELDHMVLSTQPDEARLAEYDAEVMRFFPLFAASYTKGVADGTIRDDINFMLYYQAVSHSLMGVAQKLIRGEILPSDDFSQGWIELQMAVDIAMHFLEPVPSA